MDDPARCNVEAIARELASTTIRIATPLMTRD